MNNIEFNRNLTKLNNKYKELFGNIPCIWDYSCSREEYIKAMESAVSERQELREYLSTRE